jgi:DNA topoisomerase-1
MKLVIVESPTKAKTITQFLGKDYKVASSYGHIRDLPERKMGVDIKNDFEPQYVIPAKSVDRVEILQELSKKAKEIILATDEDREGEAIAWHLSQVLGLNAKQVQSSRLPKPASPLAKRSEAARGTGGQAKFKVQSIFKRIVFHEITKSAIEKALENPRDIDINLVDAQQARRILDRLVGYELSPFLWKKIRRGLSAGRVQSVALRIIVEREKEIEKFKSEEYWVISSKLKVKSSKIKDEEFLSNLIEKNGEKIEKTETLKLFAGDYRIKKSVITDQKTADEIAEELQKSQFKVINIEEKETERTPPPPFTTSTLQQSAINGLGFSAKTTMIAAQRLYERGYITYMRTDSVNLSLASLISAKKTIDKLFGNKYSLPNPRFYKTKSKGAQEAHEAIRPTYPNQTPEDLESKLEPSEHKLYKLIWNRMIACQMQPAVFNSMRVDIEAKGEKNKYLLRANGSSVKFDGYLKVYGNEKPYGENILPSLKINDSLNLIKVNSEQKFTAPPPRYSEAGLVKVLEENGIGRPSTYAPTISTIIERKYVDKNEEKKLFPLEIGIVVNDLLAAHFPEIVDISFTANIEEDFDEIADGKEKWVPVIRKFYEPFHKHLEDKTKEVKKEDYQEKLDKKCPQCGGDLVIKYGRYGKFIACTKFPECRYTEKTEEEKKIAEEIEGEICDKCGAPMVVKRGKYGIFLGCSSYPNCQNFKKIEKKAGVKCPKCQVGDIVERKSKKGRLFWGCSSYPKCNFALWNKPTGEKCPRCNSLLVYGMKSEIKCSNKECGK